MSLTPEFFLIQTQETRLDYRVFSSQALHQANQIILIFDDALSTSLLLLFDLLSRPSNEIIILKH